MGSSQQPASDSERFRALVEFAFDPIVEVQSDQTILYVNRRFEQLSGFSAAEMVGTHVMARLHPADLSAAERARHRTEDEEKPSVVMLRFQRKNGSWLWVEVTSRGFETATGDRRAVLVVRDMSDRMQHASGLREQMGVERRIAELCRHFLTLAPQRLDEGVQEGLRTAAEIAGANRVQFVLNVGGRDRRPAFHAWNGEGMPALPEPEWKGASANFPWAARILRGDDPILVPRVDDLPDEAAAERTSLQEEGVRSYALIPIHTQSRSYGFLNLFWITSDTDFSSQDITRLQLIAEVLAAMLERHRAESGHRESEERLRTLTEHMSDALCELDEKGRLVSATSNLRELIGYDLEEMRSLGLAAILDSDDSESAAREHLRKAASGRSAKRTHRIRHRDGEQRWIEATTQDFRTAENKRHVAVVLRDVSDAQRHRAELERQLAAERSLGEFSRVFLERGAGDVEVAIEHGLEAAGRLAGAGRAYLFARRGDRREYRGFEWRAEGCEAPPLAVAEDEIEAWRWATREIERGRMIRVSRLSELPIEAEGLRHAFERDGIRSALALPIADGGRQVGVLGFHYFDREHGWKEQEINLLRLVAGLFSSVLRRQQVEEDLMESQLRLVQAQKMEAVGTLAGGIAHDFNNQLAVMLGNARYVMRSVDADPALKEALIDLERAAEHCAQLTRSLLAFSRRGSVSRQEIDLGSVVAKACELLEPLMPSSISFSTRIRPGMGTVFADATQLQQVLVNLAVNARDAMPDGGLLSISTRLREISRDQLERLDLSDAGWYAEIEVRDQGVGMDADTQSRVFEPFFTTKQVGQGTGLGLATAYGIVQDCRGAIELESEPRVGTAFRVLLPANAPGLASTVAPFVEPAHPTSSGTILLVEDEAGVRRFLARTLSAAGYEVIEADDGVNGLECLDDHASKIDFLVTDVEMPRMGGVELAEAVVQRFPRMRVLFLSGYSSDRLQADRLPVRGARFLQKPFSEDDVLGALDRLREQLA